MDSTTTADLAQVVESSNEFAVSLFSKAALETRGDLFLSPSSICSAMAMTLAGADGQTAAEMARVLRFALPGDRLHDAFGELRRTTRSGGVELHIANGLWGQRGYHFLAQFLEKCRGKYGGEFAEVDFKSSCETARREINGWVEQHTAGKICDLVPPGLLDATTRLVLVNAIYFLGCWEHEFEQELTQDEPYWTDHDATKTVPLMHQTDYFRYGEVENWQILELPYREKQIELRSDETGLFVTEVIESEEGGSDLAMTVLLPRTFDDLQAIDSRLMPAALKQQSELKFSFVELSLPRFRIESSVSLADHLRSLGMRTAFSRDDADFSKMSDNPEGLFIAAILRRAFVEVNEKGTEAAGATAVIPMAAGVFRPPIPIVFRADHPFLFWIRDRKTGLIHFMGRMTGKENHAAC